MSKRSITPSHRTWLIDEMRGWLDVGLLSPAQAAGIVELYESPAENVGRQRSLAVFALMSIAGLLVGLAVLLLVGYNWEAMPRWLKLGLVFGAVAGTHAAGFYLRYVRQMRRSSEVVFFLGCLFYGTGIWLVAQIFHLNAHYPDGVWWWALGVLPFALLLDTLLLHVLLVGLLALWAGMEVFGFGHLGAWLFGRWGLVPNGAYSLPLLALPGLVWAYRKQSAAAVGLYAPLLAWWVILQPFAWQGDANPIYFIGSVGAMFLIVSEAHAAGSRMAIPYRLYGVLLVGGALIPLSFYDVNRDWIRWGGEVAGYVEAGAIVVLGLGLLGLSVAVERRRTGQANSFLEQALWFARRQWFPVCLLQTMAGLAAWNAYFAKSAHWVEAALVPTILANVAMIGCALWLIVVGLREDRGRPFAAGVAYFLLWTVLRYVDLFGDFGGMLGAALMFFLCGAALFGVALYWHRRKEVRHA